MSGATETVQVPFEGRLVKMEPWLAELAKQPPIAVTIDGITVEVPRVSVTYDPKDQPVPRQTTIYDAAGRANIEIPTLCHREYMKPVAVCRVCAVHVARNKDGRHEGKFAPACYRAAEPGMIIQTHHTNRRVLGSIKVLTELLLADHPTPCAKHQQHGDCELELLGQRLQLAGHRLPRAPQRRQHDDSSLVIAVDHNACILCDRCSRGCNEIRGNEVIGRRGKGYTAGIAFDLDIPMGDSTCVECGECMVSCPTGALTNRSVVKPKPWEELDQTESKVTADELARHPLFEGISHAFLRFNEGAVIRRHFKKGEIICREGEFGSTAFYIEKGKVSVLIKTPFKHVAKPSRGWSGLLGHWTSSLLGRAEHRRDGERDDVYIHIDAPVALEYANPVATMEAGDLFGEMTCMSHYPRSATVQAAEDCTVLEMLRNVLYMLQRSKKSRAMLEEKYRERTIESHLRSVPIFSALNPAQFQRALGFLRRRVDLLRLGPGQVIFRQGDPADSFYLIRIGFVKITQNQPGGDHVLRYLGPGKYFGEIALLSGLPEIQALGPPAGRTATCTTLDHVDLIQIKAEHFEQLLRAFPELRQQVLETAKRRLEADEKLRTTTLAQPLNDFLNQGLMNAQSLLVLDLDKCTRCDECTKACADSHDGVTRLIREGLRFDQYLVATSCRSCLDPYCMVGCPVGSIRRRDSREIIIEDWCIGCGLCAANCPYGNINMHEFPAAMRDDPLHPGKKVAVQQSKATTCDLCSSLDGQPSCVYACPHDAAHRMSGEKLWSLVSKPD